MGFKTLAAAYAITTGKPALKTLLCAMSWRACDACGAAWPGRGWLEQTTELKPTSITDGLGVLVESGWLKIGRFPHGGRGVATEYVVLPHLRDLSTIPCGECRNRMKNPPPGGRYFHGVPQNLPLGGSFSPIPTGNGSENLPRGGTHQSEHHHQSGAALPPEEPAKPPAGENPLSSPHPSDDPANRQAAEDALRTFRALTTTPNPETAR